MQSIAEAEAAYAARPTDETWRAVVQARAARDRAELDARLAEEREAARRSAEADRQREETRRDLAEAEAKAAPEAWLERLRPHLERLVELHLEARAEVAAILAETAAQRDATDDAEVAAQLLGVGTNAAALSDADALTVAHVLQHSRFANLEGTEATDWIGVVEPPAWNDPARERWDAFADLLGAEASR